MTCAAAVAGLTCLGWIEGIEAQTDDVYDGDMAKVETIEAPAEKKKVWPPRTMDDLSPEDRAKQIRFAEKLKALAGKVKLNIDLDELRGRRP
jgi:hypothetical protein